MTTGSFREVVVCLRSGVSHPIRTGMQPSGLVTARASRAGRPANRPGALVTRLDPELAALRSLDHPLELREIVGRVVAPHQSALRLWTRPWSWPASSLRSPATSVAPSGSVSSTSTRRTAFRSTAFSVTFVGSQPVFWTTSRTLYAPVAHRLDVERQHLEPRRDQQVPEREVRVRRDLALEELRAARCPSSTMTSQPPSSTAPELRMLERVPVDVALAAELLVVPAQQLRGRPRPDARRSTRCSW